MATVADVVLFDAAEKAALRFAVPTETSGAIERWAVTHDLACERRSVVTRPVAHGWNTIESADTPGVEVGDGATKADVVIVARDGAVAAELCACEVSGDPARAGEFLGYPPCCTAAYGEHCAEPGRWITVALARSKGHPPRVWCNRLPLLWEAPTFVGEIYPCSFSCEPLAGLGLRVHQLLVAQGLRGLAQRTLDEALRPVSFWPERPHPQGSAVIPIGDTDERLPDYLEFVT